MNKLSKLFIIIGLILILVSISLFTFNKYKEITAGKKSELAIDIIKNNLEQIRNNINTPLVEASDEMMIIDKQKLISYGTSDEVLNKNVVGLHKFTKDIDSEFGNIVLAGHNNKYVFKMSKKEQIIIKLLDGNQKFVLKNMLRVNDALKR